MYVCNESHHYDNNCHIIIIMIINYILIVQVTGWCKLLY